MVSLSNIEPIFNYQVPWSSGMTSRCGRASPGSIPGGANLFFLLEFFLLERRLFYFDFPTFSSVVGFDFI